MILSNKFLDGSIAAIGMTCTSNAAMRSMKNWHRLILGCVIASVAVGSNASAGMLLTTGHSGAQVQCDVNHPQHWTYSVSQDMFDIDGALLTMKVGSQTTASISFVIFEGLYEDFGTATNLLSVTLGPSSFTQSFDFVAFTGTSISLFGGRIYTAVLFSNALDPQNQAYFIKGGSDSPLSLVDVNGNPTGNGGSIIPPVPAPGALALMLLAGFTRKRRR